VFKDQGILSGQRHVEISSWFGELESTFYKHPKSPHPDVFRVSNDPNEGCTGIVMSCVYVNGNKKSESKRFRVLRGPVGVTVFGRAYCFHIHEISYAFIGLHLTVMM
jgi:hypothetical protein